MRTFILCIFIIHFIYACNATLCGGSPCPTGNACCNDLATGYRCYNPRLYSCVANDMNQTVLCAAKLHACGTACYNRSMYVCTEGEVLCGITSSGEKIKSCNGQCYNPKKYGCCQGKLVPPGTDKHCSPVAANVTTLFCSPFNQTACASGQWCCEGTCYDPKSQVCFQDQLCPIGNKVCGGVCYSPATQECCNNKAYAKGTSICSTSTDPTCCSVSCNSTVVSAGSSLFTVSTHSQCNPTYTKSQFGSQLSCPSSTYQSCQSSSDSCENTINCGTNPLFLENCYGYNNSCSGSYLCGGGDYNTQIKSRSACPAPTSNSYESGHNKTLTSPGTSPYEYVPPAYAGKVCCWCAAPSEPIATSAIVPSYNDCNPAYVAANEYFDYPGATCRVWSRDLFDSQGLACGLPSE